MGTADRRERHRTSLRREILDAASRLFVEEGYERVTMRRIAERIEYSATTIYLHFKNKDELLGAVCEETFSQLAVKLERQQKGPGTPLGRLREGLRTYLDFGLAHPDAYVVSFMAANTGMDVAGFENSAGNRAFDTLRRAVRACVESGDIRTPDVERTAQALWAAIHGLTSLLITTRGFPFVEKETLADHLIETLLAGLKTPPAGTRSAVSTQSKKWDYFD